MPSPAVIRPRHDCFVHAVESFAQHNDVPLLTFERDQRKDDVAASYRAAFDADEGVVFIGVAQAKVSSFKCQKTTGPQGGPRFAFSRQLVQVKHYYFYVQDQQWGPAFVKVGTYLRAGVLRPLGWAAPVAVDACRSSGWLCPPSDNLAARGQPDPGLPPATVGSAVLRSRHPQVMPQRE
jgi:hypothetical protein